MGPVLVIIIINDIDREISSPVLKFTDDTKLFGCAGMDEVTRRLRKDLKTLSTWSKDWLMLFVDKCKVLHFGHKNKSVKYQTGNSDLPTDEVE